MQKAQRANGLRTKGIGLAAGLCFTTLIGCGGAELGGEPENLGPYAEQGEWHEYMAAATDTVADAADSGACSTAAIRGLSDQIVFQMNCVRSGLMTRIDGYNVSFASAAALPYLQTPAATALNRATTSRSRLSLNSTLRSVAQQYMLYHWYKTGTCGVQLAAAPGQSNHEDGMALDTSDYSAWRSALTGAGFRWFGSSDVVHFDYPGGVDAQGVLAFQRLWNRNNPGDKISEDGSYGPQTEARIRRSPRVGFAGTQTCR
jgi:hypothetical protein